MKRTLITAALVAATAPPVWASFELVMVVDQGDANNVARIHRFDGVTGSAFGTFGTGDSIGASNIALDQNAGRAFVNSYSTQDTKTWNYNTGLLVDACDNPGPGQGLVYDSKTKRLGYANADGIDHYATSGSALTSVNSINGGLLWLTQATDGTFYGGAGNGSIYRVNSFTSSAPLIGSVSANAVPLSWGHAAYGRNLSGNGMILASDPAGSSNKLRVITLSGPNAVLGGTSLTFPGFTTIISVAPAHVGFYVLGKNVQAVATLQYLTPNLQLGRSFSLPNVKGPADLAVVNAPEPAGLVALGIGAAALIRRRRR